MNIVKRLAIAAVALSILASSTASATPIIFRLLNIEAIGAAFDSVQTYTPSLWLVGSGNLDVGAGTGNFTLPDFVVEIDVLDDAVLDATVTTINWTQTVTSIVGTAITTTGGGTSSCVDEGGLGAFVCPTVSPTVLGWAPVGGSREGLRPESLTVSQAAAGSRVVATLPRTPPGTPPETPPRPACCRPHDPARRPAPTRSRARSFSDCSGTSVAARS